MRVPRPVCFLAFYATLVTLVIGVSSVALADQGFTGEYSGGTGAYMRYTGYYTTYSNNGVPWAYMTKVGGSTRRPNPNWVCNFRLYGAVSSPSAGARDSNIQRSAWFTASKPAIGGTTAEKTFSLSRKNVPWVSCQYSSVFYARADFDVATSANEMKYYDQTAPWISLRP